MSGKFMKVKKVAVATLTMLLIASQLTGCAGVTQQEAIDMVNRQDTIEIEIAVPDTETTNTEMGEDLVFEWRALAFLESYPEFREVFDTTLDITHMPDGKSGICYVTPEFKWTNNGNLRYTFMMPKFKERVWENAEVISKLNESIRLVYVDIENDNEAILAAFNTYYDIFQSPEGYFNGSDTLTRAEFLTGVYRAHNPVSTLEYNIELPENKYNPFVNQMLKYSYLDLKGNTKAYDGVITRAEAIYTLMHMYYTDALSADLSAMVEGLFTDVTLLKSNGSDTKSVELNNAIQNPDNGVPAELCQALAIAKAKGIIDGDESRWDEAITKTEALDMITRIYADADLTRAVKFEINENDYQASQDTETDSKVEDTQTNENEQTNDNKTEQTDDNKQNQPGTDTESKKGTLHIIKLPNGRVECSLNLTDTINSALSKAGLSENNFNAIKNDYYNETLDKDNTKIHTDIINKLVTNLKSELDKINNNSGNTNNNGSTKVEVDDNGYVYEDNNEYPSGDISGSDDGPRMDDPTAGQEGIDLSDIIAENTANAGDGGERVDNPDLIIGDGSGNYSNGN